MKNPIASRGIGPQSPRSRRSKPRHADPLVALLLTTVAIAAVPGASSAAAPAAVLLSPNGGEVVAGGEPISVTWTATDDVDVTSVDLFYRDAESGPWVQVARDLDNTGSFTWFVQLTPTSNARVRVVARDIDGNTGSDHSDAAFTIFRPSGGYAPTTLRDFFQPGSQPFATDSPLNTNFVCNTCHGGYNTAVEPGFNATGSMMSQAERDPLFHACLAIVEQDAPGAGDLCIRCHSAGGWLGGRSNPTDGSALNGNDRDGVSCDICHRLVDPVYKPGTSPVEDLAILSGFDPDSLPTVNASGMYVMDPLSRRRGPYTLTAPHPALNSGFHRSSDLCGTCHDVSNPVFTKTNGADYAPNAMDQAASAFDAQTLFPLERTFSEWKHSDFNTPTGIYAPEFAGNKPGGYVSSCQDCHMRDVIGRGANGAPIRTDLGLHDLTGGNYWMPGIIAELYPEEVDPAALTAGAARAVSMLQKAALLDVQTFAEGDSFRAEVTVTNRSGHKLPTGYPEGRRMWLHVRGSAFDGTTVFESGGYIEATGELVHDPQIVVYEAKLGLSPGLAGALGLPGGPTFHFALNDTVVKDNRIPPVGFTNASYGSFGGAPVDPDHPGVIYPDGQNWDRAVYTLPPAVRKVVATLYYQTTSKEYIEFLRDENVTNAAGQTLCDLWNTRGKAAPVAMVSDSALVPAAGVDLPVAQEVMTVQAGPNPTAGRVELKLILAAPSEVRLEVFDLNGRLVYRAAPVALGGGPQALAWDGRDDDGRDVGSGIFFARVAAGGRVVTRRVVRLR